MADSPGYRADRPAASTRSVDHRQHGIDTNLHVDETDDGYAVIVDLPGFERDDLAVRFEDGVLVPRRIDCRCGNERWRSPTHRRVTDVHLPEPYTDERRGRPTTTATEVTAALGRAIYSSRLEIE